jgi:hypothetical protein
MIALVIAVLGAFAAGIRGGWAMAQTYFELNEQREASR